MSGQSTNDDKIDINTGVGDKKDDAKESVSEERVQLSKDMYGFLREESYVAKERQFRRENGKAIAKRDQQWVKFLGRCSIDNIAHNRKDRSLKRLVYEGVPVAFRGPVWNALSGARELKAESDRTYNEYCEDAIKLISDNDAQKVMIEDENHRGCDKGQAIKDIEKDVFRTFPDHSMFDVDGTGIQQLRRILLAYSVWNPAVGYCQGLNFMAAALLLFLDEEDSFWILCSLCKNILPPKYYTPKLFDLHVDVRVLQKLIETKLPSVQAVFQDHHIDVRLIAMEWFMCSFLNIFPLETTTRVWDVMLYERSSLPIFRVALGLFKLLQPELEEIFRVDDNRDIDEVSEPGSQNVLQYIADSAKVQFDVEILFKASFSGKCNVSKKEIEKWRKLCKAELQIEIEEIQSRREIYRKKHEQTLNKAKE